MAGIWSKFKPLVSAFFGNNPKQALLDIANNFNLAVNPENMSKVMLAMNKLDILKPVKSAVSWMRPSFGQMRGMMGGVFAPTRDLKPK